MPFTAALAKAIETGDINLIKPLITAENAWDTPNEEGLKPIHVAIDHGQLEVVDWLLKNGVSLECATVPNGSTPLHRAAFKGQTKIIEHLLKVYQDNPKKMRADGVTPLYFAAQEGHTESVALLLEHGANIGQADNNGASPLYVAAQEGHTATVALLLEHKADIGQARTDGANPLLVAAFNGHTETVVLLLKHEADINQNTYYRQSPLFVAAKNGHTETVALLLEHKADIGETAFHGRSPLFVAAQNGHTESVALLLEHQADIGQIDNYGRSPLYVAAQNGQTATVELLLKHKADIGQTDNEGRSSLNVAAQQGHREIFTLLLEHIADIGQTDNNGASPLLVAAAQEGHTATVALLLEHQADIGQVDNDGRCPLYAAAQNGHTATVKLLLEHQPDIGQTNNSGASPLYIAAEKGHTATVALLLEHQADIGQANNNGASPLFVAACYGHRDTVALLLEHKADIEQTDNDGRSPLWSSAFNGHQETVALLLTHNADIGQANNNGASPLFVAAQEGHTATVALLLAHKADIGQATKHGASPLYMAAYNGHTETVALLLEQKADIGQTNNYGRSPLLSAAFNGHQKTVALLLAHNADIRQTDNGGRSPLWSAAINGHQETVALLLAHNADIGQTTKDGFSPLYVAAQNGHKDTVALLLAHKADIGQATKNGANALFAAAQYGHKETVALLLEHKADTSKAMNDGVSPLLIATEKCHTQIIALLLDHQANIEQASHDGACPLYVAAQKGHLETVALFLERGANINQSDNDGRSPLYIAALLGHKETVALLLAHKADNSKATNEGTSPLCVAAQEGHKETVTLLLAHGAKIDEANNHGESPLFFAAQNGHKETVTLLLEHKADIDQITKKGASPLYIAAQNGHTEMVTLLLERGANIEQVDNEGASPLFAAAKFGQSQTVTLLLKQGALKEKATLAQQTPLWIAAHEGHDKVVDILLTNGALLTPDDKGDTPLHIAVKQGHIAVVKHLVLKNTAVTAFNADKQTPLMLAARSHDTVIFSWLLTAWFQQQVLNKQEAEQKPALDNKNEPLPKNSYLLNDYETMLRIDSISNRDFSHWSSLPPTALTLAKATRQALSLEINQQQWQSTVKLGEGAFGEVFRLTLPVGHIALKRMKLEEIAKWFKVTSEEAQTILQWEISQLEKVRHPHVVELLSVASSETPLLAMELCDKTLDKAVPKTPYGQWQVAWEVASGLAYLHGLSLVHRDIKPENILLKENIAKIADMGLAQIDPLLLDSTEPAELQRLIGDTNWASPEEKAAFKAYHDRKGSIADIKKVSTAAADIYRYGLVLNNFCQPVLFPVIEACLQQNPKHRPHALQIINALEQNIPHDHPVLAKLCQRLGIFAHYHEHELAHFLSPWVSSQADIDWLTFQEGIEVKGNEAPQPFSALWQSFLSHPEKRSLDMRGAGGLGKTLLGYYQLKEQWQALRQWLINPEGNPPTLVLLLTPDYLQTTDFTLEERLAEVYQLDQKECDILKQYPVVFLLDGEDEWQARPQLDLREWPNAKTWIVGRPSLSAKDSVYLLPFNQVQIVNYLRNTLTWDQATTQDFITQLPLSAIREVLRNPFVLSMFRLLWPLPRWQDLTKEAIYHTYFTQFIEKQQSHWLSGPYRKIYAELITHLQQEHKTLAESYLRFAGEVSLQLFEAKRLEGKVMVDSPWTKMPEKIQRLAEDAFNEKQQLLLAKKEKTHLTLQQYQAFALAHLQRFVTPAPLELGYYRFRHKSLFEYAWAYSALLPKRPLEEDEALLSTYSLIHREDKEEKLDFALIEASKKDPTLARKAGNLLTLYNWARVPLTYNYQGAHIENANLAYANLIQADFSNTHFDNCYFANACIEKAHFDQVPDVTQKEKRPHPPLLGHSKAILHSAISANGQLLATLDQQQIFIWQNQHCVRHFLTHIAAPTALAIDNNGEFLIGDEDGYVYFYSDNRRQRKLRAHFEPILSVEFVNEDLCWVGSTKHNILYQRKNYAPEKQWPNLYASVTCSAFNSLSRQHALGRQDGNVVMNDVEKALAKELWRYQLHQGQKSTALRFSLTGKLAAGGEDGLVYVVYEQNSSSNRIFYSTHPILNLHWSQDSQSLVAITSQGFRVWEVSTGRELGNFKAAAIQAIYMKNSHEGILVEKTGNLYGIALKNGEINFTWVVAGEHFQGGINIQPINETPASEQAIKEQQEAKIEQQPVHNNQILLTPALQQQGLFADRNQNAWEEATNLTQTPDQETSSSTEAKSHGTLL